MDASEELTKDERIRELEEMLYLKHEMYVVKFGLTQQQAKLMALLMEVPVASAELITKRMQMNTEAKVVVHRLRTRMKQHGIDVCAKRYHGFWLSDEDKAKITEAVS